MIFNERRKMNYSFSDDLMKDKEIMIKIFKLMEKRQLYLNDKINTDNYDESFYSLLNDMIIKEINKLKNMLIARWSGDRKNISETFDFEKQEDELDLNYLDEFVTQHIDSDYELNKEWL